MTVVEPTGPVAFTVLDSTVRPFAEVVLRKLGSSQSMAEKLVEGIMAELGLGSDVAFNAGWIAQEPVGNALRHATAPFVLQLRGNRDVRGAYVAVCLVDALPVPVDMARYIRSCRPLTFENLDALPLNAPALEHRRGLAMIVSISDGPGCEIWPSWKAVWSAMRVSSGAQDHLPCRYGSVWPCSGAPVRTTHQRSTNPPVRT
ncbi:hypothetical protein [Actinorugispora endophytica]|uniref:Uncharacterized protein n=1 Tax=Actinorugispora endophytica TaxID=1605990 RepID=A0A4V3D8U3_9ACTN|nr:hypothetical protein [Actinorugispora endophytica]TDQ53121.1 hypothetical protein EV190_105243 [Actinorugispora endophytica]